jgi:hypothetical protein
MKKKTNVNTQNKLYNAIQSNDTRTENGMPTNSTSGSYLLDMFFKMGGMRGQNESEILSLFVNAFNENPVLAVKAMFNLRDIRGGMGERRSFRVMFKWLCENQPEYSTRIMDLIMEYGRPDDLFEAFDTPCEKYMMALVRDILFQDCRENNIVIF